MISSRGRDAISRHYRGISKNTIPTELFVPVFCYIWLMNMLIKVLHIVLSLNLLVSSMGITAYEHICSLKGTTFSLFVKPKSCCSKKKNKSNGTTLCTKHSNTAESTIKRKPCCEDKSSYAKLSVSATSIDKIVFSDSKSYIDHASIPATFSWKHSGILNEKTFRTFFYKPPPVRRDNLRVLYQSFLC